MCLRMMPIVAGGFVMDSMVCAALALARMLLSRVLRIEARSIIPSSACSSAGKTYSCSLYGCSFLSPPSQAQANMDLGSMTWARMCINMPLWAFSSAGMRCVVADEPCHCLCSLLRRASDLLRRVPAKSESSDMVV